MGFKDQADHRILVASFVGPVSIIDSSLSIIQFIGDIHQPLHDEALDVGGNTVPVTFDGTSTNLHAVWDTSIPGTLRLSPLLTLLR